MEGISAEASVEHGGWERDVRKRWYDLLRAFSHRRLASAEHLESGEPVLDVRVTGRNSNTDISPIIYNIVTRPGYGANELLAVLWCVKRLRKEGRLRRVE